MNGVPAPEASPAISTLLTCTVTVIVVVPPSAAEYQLSVGDEELLHHVVSETRQRCQRRPDGIGAALAVREVTGEADDILELVALDDLADRLLPERRDPDASAQILRRFERERGADAVAEHGP